MRWILCGLMLVVLGCRGGRVGTARDPAGRDASARFPPPFECQGGRCTQRYPRVPDDSEWTCADAAGAALCVGGEHAAGVAPAPGDRSWRCGPRRRGRADPLGPEVCLDARPETPDGRMAGWRCWFVHDDPPMRRVCQRDAATPTLADACDARRGCVDGSRCADGRCQLPSAAPDCWLDADCGGRRCRLGHCDEGRP